MKYSGYFLSVLIFCICEFYTSCLNAQNSEANYVEVILFNGHKISGYLYFNQNNKSVTISPSDSISIVVPTNIIKTINYMPKRKSHIRQNQGIRFFNNTSFGFAVGNNPNSGNPAGSITAEMVNGITILPALQVGFGIGYDIYDQVSAMPFSISLVGDILKGDITPYYFIEAGTSKSWINDYPFQYQNYSDANGKKMINLGLGYRIYSESHFNLGFSIGYKIQDVSLKAQMGSGTLNTNLTYRRMGFKICLGF